MCHIYLQKLEPETKKINSTKSVLHQLNDVPPPPPTPKELVTSRSPGQYKLRKKKKIIAAERPKGASSNIIRI